MEYVLPLCSLGGGGGVSHVPCSCRPLSEKQSGEQSQISWAYYPKVVMTNETARSVFITHMFSVIQILSTTIGCLRESLKLDII